MHVNNYSLIIPSWYPAKDSPVNGVFVKKHAQLISAFIPVQVVYCTSSVSQTKLLSVSEREAKSLAELIVYHRLFHNKLLNQVMQLIGFLYGWFLVTKRRGLPKMLHLHVVYPAGYFVWLIKIFYPKLPLVITEHWTGYSDEDGRFARLPNWQKSLISKVYSKATAIAPISMYLEKELRTKRLIKDDQKVVVTSNALEFPSGVTDRLREKQDKGRIGALCIATLNDAQKNISGLLDATLLICKTHPNFLLTIVGYGPEEQKLKQYAAKLGLESNVVFTGKVANEDIPAYYQSNDLFVLNSNYETFSIATAEAILYGLPVVVTKCGGPEEFVDETNGLLVSRNNPVELAGAIEELIRKNSSYDRKQIAKQMRYKYSKEEVLNKIRQLYNIALAS